jgi:hypothetical protein
MQRCEESTPAFRLISALAALRKISPAIQRGTYIPLYAKGDVLIYERIDKERIDGDRTDGDDLVLVAVNRASATDVELQSRMGFSPGSLPRSNYRHELRKSRQLPARGSDGLNRAPRPAQFNRGAQMKRCHAPSSSVYVEEEGGLTTKMPKDIRRYHGLSHSTSGAHQKHGC